MASQIICGDQPVNAGPDDCYPCFTHARRIPDFRFQACSNKSLADLNVLLLVLRAMSKQIESRLRDVPVVPLVQAEDPAVAVKTAQALVAGGLRVIEVVMRTDEALQCLSAVVESIPAAITGAGTVLNAEQAQAAIEAGAQFIVSPGLDDGVVDVAMEHGLPVYPGVATATELMCAWNMGLRAVKFFPAGQAGGPAMLKSLSSVFRDVSFMPTGGVAAANLADYLAIPAVIACGGSWLTPKIEIDAGNYAAITQLAKEAVSSASSARG